MREASRIIREAPHPATPPLTPAPLICYTDPMDRETHDFYRRHARDLAARYRTGQGGISAHFAEAFAGLRRVLDVGCGAGSDLCRLLRLGHDARGADACREMVEQARESLRGLEGLDAEGPEADARVVPSVGCDRCGNLACESWWRSGRD